MTKYQRWQPDDDRAPTTAEGLLEVADAIHNLAVQVKYLGNGDAATHFGAIEGLAMLFDVKMDDLTEAIGSIANMLTPIIPEEPSR